MFLQFHRLNVKLKQNAIISQVFIFKMSYVYIQSMSSIGFFLLEIEKEQFKLKYIESNLNKYTLHIHIFCVSNTTVVCRTQHFPSYTDSQSQSNVDFEKKKQILHVFDFYYFFSRYFFQKIIIFKLVISYDKRLKIETKMKLICLLL